MSRPNFERTDSPTAILTFSRDACRKVDQAAMEEFGIPGIVLMENASGSLAAVAMQMLMPHSGEPHDQRPVIIVCGGGNNGGDGYALARHLHNAGIEVELVRVAEPRPGTDASTNAEICRRMRIPTHVHLEPVQLDRARLVVDALLGTGLDRPPEGAVRAMIEQINASGVPVLAVDLPSGLDCDTGRPLGTAVRATVTVSFLGIKKGFRHPEAARYTGHVEVGAIGAPRELLYNYGEWMQR